MGGLFSSEPARPVPARSPYVSSTSYRDQYVEPRPQPRTTTTTNPTAKFQWNTPANSQLAAHRSYDYEQPGFNSRGQNLTATLYNMQDVDNWQSNSLNIPQKGYTLVTLDRESADYQKVYTLFRETAQRQLKITKIDRVENPFLFASYILKREELKSRYGNQTRETEQFHGTKYKNVEAICSNNFNWRLHGDSLGNRFGQGVSFSPIANYSSHYCDNRPTSENTMFVARVLVTKSFQGSKSTILPPNGFDTAAKENGQVSVKFCDDEFYPEFIVYYTGLAIKSIK